MVDIAYVLAGGFGTRLRPVIGDLPKPMAGVAGRPFLEHLFDYLLAQGVARVVICSGYRAELIEAYFGQTYRGCDVLYSVEAEPLGTGGALSKALERFKPEVPFLVANGDTYFPIDTKVLFSCLGEASWALASFRAAAATRYGALQLGPGGTVLGLQAGHPLGEPFQANSGIWIGNPTRISVPLVGPKPGYSLEEYLSEGLAHRALTAVAREFDSPFVDIGLPEDFVRAQKMAQFLGDYNQS
jgi:D-glycero-alpha-D-manno-heptose 1-phosphate guanylyltransferase